MWTGGRINEALWLGQLFVMVGTFLKPQGLLYINDEVEFVASRVNMMLVMCSRKWILVEQSSASRRLLCIALLTR